ncbi:DUF4856 domain-containing protein [Catenovulum adriaticum]|uniref:DUF4856 domain-containing protein n=1 Tax=Catenovulum adriaticum TaxID=2984846 RepID=A0ABY7AQJ3_9ALTE|nr:DUF4856 domain-containing protein [Catenovulum sp. TS8]WAJ71552.1 DUF4856 domain-containing protein [Catenovulum sp. TS8]
MRYKHSVLAAAILTFITGCGSSSDSDNEQENTAPSAIVLSSNTVMENQTEVTLGELSATDDNSADLTFELAENADSRFEIEGNSLKLKADTVVDYETETSISLPIIVSDGEMSTEETVQIIIEDELDYYAFPSKFINGEDSVSYSGQVARHAIISQLNNYISSELEQDLNNQVLTTEAEILAKLNAYYFAQDSAPVGIDVAAILDADISFVDNSEQSNINAISSGKNLKGKIAGNDATGQHKDWTAGDTFVGFGADFMGNFENTPEGLLLALFDKLAKNSIEFYTNGTLSSPYITAEGHDLKQLIQKFLLMSVAFSQGTDDYLDDDTQGKGLLSEHTQDGESAYSKLEHQWDEGFGYFGAARNYLAYSDLEIAAKGGRDGWNSGYYDINQDGKIDLNSEYNFGNSTNAAKRDLGSNGVTDYTQDAMQGFLKGRQLLNETAGNELTAEQMTELQGYRDSAVLAWEQSVAATVVHYINDTHADVSAIGTTEFSLTDVAKHWSELKGFFLGLQFNPRSPLSDADFTAVNELIGDMPATTDTEKEAYLADLIKARNILEASYSFDATVTANW